MTHTSLTIESSHDRTSLLSHLITPSGNCRGMFLIVYRRTRTLYEFRRQKCSRSAEEPLRGASVDASDTSVEGAGAG